VFEYPINVSDIRSLALELTSSIHNSDSLRIYWPIYALASVPSTKDLHSFEYYTVFKFRRKSYHGR
jgi:hypothetical protein